MKLTFAFLIVALIVINFARSDEATPERCPTTLVPVERSHPVYPGGPVHLYPGWVILEFQVLGDGRTSTLKVVESSNRIFERSALAAVSAWTYPEQSITCTHTFKLSFALE